MIRKINLAEKFASFDERWSPRIVAEIDDYDIKLAKLEGDFVWHAHEHEDELFIVVKGAMRIDFRDGHVELEEGECVVVPRGLEHKPFAARECQVLLMERKGVVNTGNAEPGRLTAAPNQRI